MLYLDISIYFFLFAVLSSKIFFKDAIAYSLPYLSFLTKPLFVYVLLLLLEHDSLIPADVHADADTDQALVAFLTQFRVRDIGRGRVAIVAERHYAPDSIYRRFVYLHDLSMRNRTNHRRRSHQLHAYRTYYHPDFNTDWRYRGHDTYLFLRPLLYGEILFYEQDDAERYAERGVRTGGYCPRVIF